MASDTLSKLVTYDDYRQLPDDGKQYQIIGGELYMTPAPTTIHQRILFKLAQAIASHAADHNLGEILIAPVDVILSMTDVVQPDIVFVAKERMNIITQKNIVEAPDLVVEVLSGHTETIDRKKKRELYARHGVREYWIVDPEAKTIDQFLNENGQLTRTHTIKSGETLASKIVEGLQVSVDEIFKEL